MSIAISHDPRYYGRRAFNGVLRNPPECSCTATLVDRKFIASSGPPPPVDAQRLARTLTCQFESPRAYNLCVYPDRILFHPLSRGPGLADILYDDIIQIEMIYIRDNLLFILCGRRGIGMYFFFRLSNEFVGERIIAIASRAYPNLNNPPPTTNTPRNFPQRRFGGRSSPAEHIYESGHPIVSNRFAREQSAPPSSSSSTSSDNIYARPAKDINRQSSYIRWEGYRPNRKQNQGRQPRRLSAPKRAASVRVFRSPSSSPSPRDFDNGEVLYIKAQGRGSMRRRRNPAKSKRQPLLILEGNRSHSKPVAKAGYGYKKKRRSPQSRNQSRPRKISPPVKPKTFILQPSLPSNYDDSIDSELSYNVANEVQPGKYRHSNVANVETIRYRNQNGNNAYDWGSTDSWDFFSGKTPNQPRINIYKNPGTSVPIDEGYVADNISTSSEDSLYLEREQEMASYLPNRQTNYIPDIQSKFHQININ
nr:hypothetical protein HmN_000339100 [Hymenolepis microstoma]